MGRSKVEIRQGKRHQTLVRSRARSGFQRLRHVPAQLQECATVHFDGNRVDIVKDIIDGPNRTARLPGQIPRLDRPQARLGDLAFGKIDKPVPQVFISLLGFGSHVPPLT